MRWSSGHGRELTKPCSSRARPAGSGSPPSTSAAIDIGFDTIGGAILEQTARLMNWGGRLMPIGFTSGTIPSIPMNLPLLKNYAIIGVFAGAWAEKFSAEAARMNDTLMQLLADGNIRPHIDRILPLAEAADAMRAIANRTVQGKIVLKIR